MLAFFILGAVSASAHADPTLDTWGITSLTGGYYGSQTDVGSALGKGYYSLSARTRTMRFQDAVQGTREEYSAQLRRELYHVSVGGRLGTSPPNMDRAEYHLAGADVLFTFYGLTLGPEHTALAPVVWESSGPAPSPGSLDRTWVSTIHTIYTNTNVHMQRVGSNLIVVQNSWQFELRETWREESSLALQLGGDRYNRVLANTVEKIFLDNVQYLGNPFAVRGWPNNFISGEVWQRFGNWRASFAATRLNVLDNGLVIQYGAELERRIGSRWTVKAGYFHKRRRGVDTREGAALSVACRW